MPPAGQFGIPEGVVFSMPVKFENGTWVVLTDLEGVSLSKQIINWLTDDLIQVRQRAYEGAGFDNDLKIVLEATTCMSSISVMFLKTIKQQKFGEYIKNMSCIWFYNFQYAKNIYLF